MIGLSEIVIELSTFGMFRSVESVNYKSISKDHIGDIKAEFNNQEIRVPVYSGDNAETIAEKIVKSAKY
ncbi:hypothetical protein [Aestuariibaculum suncheonense]|uniref:Uncharacterized protein n=1 Tax=Aestuariibaculum suncheonense TaxID=1028745 RepID=A0A8J6QB23_9FLAO|nr:hypothetical protein [Aestuariibaculum suncheonense]MBD0834483.1 hypothetical protein [Aestuariibaculum suncheonense]